MVIESITVSNIYDLQEFAIFYPLYLKHKMLYMFAMADVQKVGQHYYYYRIG